MKKDKFNPNWSDFEKKVKEYNETELRGIFYYLATQLVKSGDKNKGIKTILLSWNWRAFNNGDISPKELDKQISNFLDEYDKEIQKLQDISKISFKPNETSLIKKAYGNLFKGRRMGHTGVSKLLHIIKPDLFVMWDEKIKGKYHERHKRHHGTGECYVEFLKEMKKMGNNLFGRKQEQRLLKLSRGREYQYSLTIPKVLDEYNMRAF
jgi:hypothetical protein